MIEPRSIAAPSAVEIRHGRKTDERKCFKISSLITVQILWAADASLHLGIVNHPAQHVQTHPVFWREIYAAVEIHVSRALRVPWRLRSRLASLLCHLLIQRLPIMKI